MARPQRSVVKKKKKNIVNIGSKMKQKLSVRSNNVVREGGKASVTASRSPLRTPGKSKQGEVMKEVKVEEKKIGKDQKKNKRMEDKKTHSKVVMKAEKLKSDKMDKEKKTLGKVEKKEESINIGINVKVEEKEFSKTEKNEKKKNTKSNMKLVVKKESEQKVLMNEENNMKKEEGKNKTAKRKRSANHISVATLFTLQFDLVDG